MASTMNGSPPSHDEDKAKTKTDAMPFILDNTQPPTEEPAPLTAPTPGTTTEPDIVTSSDSSVSSPTSSSPRSHRAQSTSAVIHHPLRPVPEEIPPPVLADHATTSTSLSPSPRRQRATTTLAKPRTSAERVPEEDAGWWTEEIHKRREIRRRMREVEDENTVIIGNKVDSNHPNYITAYNMLTGLRVAVSRVSAKVDRKLTDEDFKFCQKFTFDNQGNELSPASKHDFKFKDYAPWVFRHLRALFHLDAADYLISLTSHILLSELSSPGKSRSFFYFSRDYRFVIKTLHHAEHRYLRKTLRQYYEHVKSNPNTLISQFYGLHRVKMRGRKVHLVVINNVFPAHKDIHQTYDLKGSTIGREFDENRLKENPKGPLKDLNWIHRNMAMYFGPRKRNLLLSQLKKDVELLSSLNIMDYSLLVGVHDVSRGNSENIRGNTLSVYQPKLPPVRTPSKKGNEGPPPLKRLATNLPTEEFLERKMGFFTSEDGGLFATNSHDEPTGDYVYYFGVIDLLTTYGPKKHLETFFKGFSFPRNELSAVPPQQYADRFVNFIRSNVHPKDDPKAATAPAALRTAYKEDLSHVPIPEEDPPSPTPLQRARSAGDLNLDIGRTVVRGPEATLPAIRIEHPSPPPAREVFEGNGVGVGLVNGVKDDYFEEKQNGLHV